MKSGLLILLSLGLLMTNLGISEIFGHGVGYEVLPPEKLGDKLVSLEVISSRYENPDSPDREVTFSLFDIDTGITIRDVTFQIRAEKGNNFLFEDTFESDNGIFVMSLIHSDSGPITIEKSSQGDFFGALMGTDQEVFVIKGPEFSTGGLYNFDVKILTAESFSNKLDNPIEYLVGLSIPDRTFYDIQDPNFGNQELGVITYYDLIEDFSYDPQSGSISFKMPFDWSQENINQTSVVHEEVTIPKTYGDLMVETFSITVNELEMPQRVLTVDDFSENERLVHIVVSQNDLFEIMNNQDTNPNEIRFLLKPNTDNEPLTTITENGQFRVSLNWEPNEIKSGSDAEFIFDITDVFLRNRPVSVNYEFSLTNNGNQFFETNGISTDSKGEHNIVPVFIPETVTGIVSVQFENLAGNEFASAELPVVVNRILDEEEITIPDWVRNNAGWWAEGSISDKDFASGIEYMIVHGIIIVPKTENQNEESDTKIPDWVRNNAGWWAEGSISDKDFASGIQYLIGRGVISV